MKSHGDYSPIVTAMKEKYGIRIRRWRKSMTGVAWQVVRRNGKVIRWVCAPRPKTAISLSIFLHEVGHHVIGFTKYGPGCEEEYHVWQWALAQMRRLGIAIDENVRKRFWASMEYAVRKALRRGLPRIPKVLRQFQVASVAQLAEHRV